MSPEHRAGQTAGEHERRETKTARRGAPGGSRVSIGGSRDRGVARADQFAAAVRFFWAGWIGPGKITLLTVWSPEPSE